MKTIDEVIEKIEEFWVCPCVDEANEYCDLMEVREDVLHHLKEYRGLLKMWNDKLDKEQANPALTWDELRTMEGRPVWMEEENQPSQWYLIGDVETDEDDYPEFASMIVYDCQGDYLFYKNNMGITWQAYQKERYDDIG